MYQRATRALVGCLVFLSGCYSTFAGKEIVSDLKTETAERAASTNTDCTAGGLMAGINKVVQKRRP